VQKFLSNWSTDDTYSFRGWDQSDSNRSTFTSDLTWDSVDISDLVSPISSSDWDNVELGVLKTILNGDLDFLGDFDTDSDVSILVSDSNNGLESGSLTSSSLLLDRHDLHDFVTEILEEVIDDLVFFDWQRVSVDLF